MNNTIETTWVGELEAKREIGGISYHDYMALDTEQLSGIVSRVAAAALLESGASDDAEVFAQVTACKETILQELAKIDSVMTEFCAKRDAK